MHGAALVVWRMRSRDLGAEGALYRIRQPSSLHRFANRRRRHPSRWGWRRARLLSWSWSLWPWEAPFASSAPRTNLAKATRHCAKKFFADWTEHDPRGRKFCGPSWGQTRRGHGRGAACRRSRALSSPLAQDAIEVQPDVGGFGRRVGGRDLPDQATHASFRYGRARGGRRLSPRRNENIRRGVQTEGLDHRERKLRPREASRPRRRG